MNRFSITHAHAQQNVVYPDWQRPPRPRSRRPLNRRRLAGITLLELMIAVALVGILAAIATPAFRNVAGRYRLNAASRETANLINRARVLAVSRNVRTRFVFTEVDSAPTTYNSLKGVVRIEQWNSTLPVPGWSVAGDNRSYATVSGTQCNRVSTLPDVCLDIKRSYLNVSLTYVDPVGTVFTDAGGRNCIEFGPDGLVANPLSDFKMGSNEQEIVITLSYKMSQGQMDSRIIYVNRGGTTRLETYRGVGLPTP